MADGQVTEHSLGEVWGKVESLDANFKNLDGKLDRVFDAITVNHEKTERRISEHARDVDRRLEQSQSSSQTTSQQRAAGVLQVIGILLTAIIGAGTIMTGVVGMIFTFYTLTKAPIDNAFGRQDIVNKELSNDLKSIATLISAERSTTDRQVEMTRKDTDEKLKNYVPQSEVKGGLEELKNGVAGNTARIVELEKKAATSETDRIAIRHERDLLIGGVEKEIKAITKEIDTLRTSVSKDMVSRSENENRWADLRERVTVVTQAMMELRKTVSDGNGIGDRMNRIQHTVEELQSILMVKIPNTGK